MSKYELKELIIFIIFSIINLCIAYMITGLLGIQNIVLYESFTATQYIITYEILIWFALSFIDASFYHLKYEI